MNDMLRRGEDNNHLSDATRRESTTDVTRLETRIDATRLETSRSASDALTQREDATASQSRRTKPLPVAIASEYERLSDLDARGGEADISLLQSRSSGLKYIFKDYRTGISPNPMVIQTLKDANPKYVVRIIDYKIDNTEAWEIQEYCSLGSLKDWVAARGGKLDKDMLNVVLIETAEALKYLHGLGLGIAHRDLKPANVLVRAENPADLVLTDFGLATAQAFTHLTQEVKGTWHYAAPEVHSNQSSAKSDWFSLGAMIYEFYVGHKLFSTADGVEVSEIDAKSRCLTKSYSTEQIDDPRWRLLINGLLTWDKDFRWGFEQVEAWVRGESPPIHAERIGASGQPSAGGITGFRPSWTPATVTTPQELAEQIRQHWHDAAEAFAGRPDQKLTNFLKSFPDTEEALALIKSNEALGPKLIRLQAALDPNGPISFAGTVLDEASLAHCIKTADDGDEAALKWLKSVVDERILKVFADVTGSKQAAQADYFLEKWKNQAMEATRRLPSEYQALAREAFRTGLPELFAAALRQND